MHNCGTREGQKIYPHLTGSGTVYGQNAQIAERTRSRASTISAVRVLRHANRCLLTYQPDLAPEIQKTKTETS